MIILDVDRLQVEMSFTSGAKFLPLTLKALIPTRQISLPKLIKPLIIELQSHSMHDPFWYMVVFFCHPTFLPISHMPSLTSSQPYLPFLHHKDAMPSLIDATRRSQLDARRRLLHWMALSMGSGHNISGLWIQKGHVYISFIISSSHFFHSCSGGQLEILLCTSLTAQGVCQM